MEQFANSRFWKTIAVVVVVLLALDVSLRWTGGGVGQGGQGWPALTMAKRSGGIVFSPTSGIVTTNAAGTIVYKWGLIEGSPAGMTVIKFDLNKQSIDRFDLK